MADQYLNAVDLATIRDWANGKFALDADLDTLADEVAELITEGGEPNIIETVKVNGTPLVPDGNKAVNVDLSAYALSEDVPTDLSDLTNTAQDPYATQGYVDQNGGKIDVIKVNGTAQTITNKEVNLDLSGYAETADLPTAVSDLSNDLGFQTASDVSSAISAATTSIYRYKGSVATKSALPSNAENGDVYDVQSNGVNYAWNGTTWDALGGEFDVTLLWSKAELTAMTVAEVNAILEPSA